MKKEISLSDAELKLMDILWRGGAQKARDVAAIAKEETGWEKNTVYTMLGRLIEKGAILREEPDFVCAATVQKGEIAKERTRHLLDKLYDGSSRMFLRAFIREQNLTRQDIEELRRIIDEEK